MRSLALALPALVTAYVAYAPAEGTGTSALQNILKNTDKTDKYRYPTDFTRGIEPVSLNPSSTVNSQLLTLQQKPFHSHNDYWRDVPFYSGLAAGAISTEADVWLIDGTLYVGSERIFRSSCRSSYLSRLQPLYVPRDSCHIAATRFISLMHCTTSDLNNAALEICYQLESKTYTLQIPN